MTPTNLLYNVIAIPGALGQFHSTRLYRRSTRQVEAAEIPIEGEAMYASVRKYDVAPEGVEEFMRRVDTRFAPRLEGMPGFVAYQVIDSGLDRAGEARIFAITLCHDRDAAERSAEIAADFVDEELGDLGVERLEAAIGTVSVSRAVSEVLEAAHA